MERIHESKNKFYIGANEDEPIGLLNYHIEKGNLVIEHVYVTKALRGQGLGIKLVERAVIYARENNLKIISNCSYADKALTENDTYRDVF